MHRFEDLRWRAKLDLVFGMFTALRVANPKELTLAALKQSTPSELHIREIAKLGHVELPSLAGTVLYRAISGRTGADD
jgi:hypothetical protein